MTAAVYLNNQYKIVLNNSKVFWTISKTKIYKILTKLKFILTCFSIILTVRNIILGLHLFYLYPIRVLINFIYTFLKNLNLSYLSMIMGVHNFRIFTKFFFLPLFNMLFKSQGDASENVSLMVITLLRKNFLPVYYIHISNDHVEI